MQVDLGAVCDVNSLSLYRYWGDGRTYGDTVVAVAEKKKQTFAEGKATIVYNADDQNVHKLYTQAPENSMKTMQKLHRVNHGRSRKERKHSLFAFTCTEEQTMTQQQTTL